MNKLLVATLLMISVSAFSSEEWFDAARKGNVERVESLLKLRPELLNLRNEKGYTALVLSSYNDQQILTSTLLSIGSDPCLSDEKGNNALMGVIFKGHVRLISELIEKCDVNHRNFEGQTPLMYASLFGREQVVKTLIKLGADRNLRDNEGRTALSLAQGQWNKMMVSLIKTFNIIER